MRLGIIFAAVLATLAGKLVADWWIEREARQNLNEGAISTALWWLSWADWLPHHDGRIDLLRATCLRRNFQIDAWRDELNLAAKRGAPREETELESQLGLIQLGQLHEENGLDLSVLSAAAVSSDDLGTALVHGYLARGKPEMAQIALTAWSSDQPLSPQLAYMRGVFWRWSGDQKKAQVELERAFARQSDHELARVTLAEMLEEQHRLELAFAQHVETANRFPHNELARVAVARVLRKLGRYADARNVLKSLNSPSQQTVLCGLGQIELELGHYQQASVLFEKAGLERIQAPLTLAAAATASAFQGDPRRAEQLFTQLDTGQVAPPRTWENTSDDASAADLYSLHCAVCHGAEGDGQGRAARFLYARPRDLIAEGFRLVSAANGVPALSDVKKVIERGMPGTSMPAFDKLSESQRGLLAKETLRMRRAGAESRFREILKDEGQDVDPSELEEIVQLHTTPETPLAIPDFGSSTAALLAKGKELYVSVGCHNCHGENGSEDTALLLFEDSGFRTLPRNLVHDPFKGGNDLASVYLRIRAGMPGTPHPSTSTLPEQQLAALVRFCCSLSRESQHVSTNHDRAVAASRRIDVPQPRTDKKPVSIR